ncbi:glycosyltransferase family 4 protein [Paenibacillus glycanilyticus]|uniref:glycosyltransferase family 4 protein n=1 Tax=Paenibacillus glycanilyticus TaxID=126569 RepID=UPI00203AF54F|nr:glycosyltransferase family 4 protein [Paenibacillus glycanilyticus]MCM3628006.1 glycosyltransferase family 4 protein [Paenibacillus glycanilyticus]
MMNNGTMRKAEAKSAGTVTLLTHSYLNGYGRDYSRLFGGGLERYVDLLCRAVKELGLTPVVYQLTYYEPFDTVYEGVRVRGWPFDAHRITEAFELMAESAEGLLIYASCIWHPIRYRPGSIGICHGINWDTPSLAAETKAAIGQHIHQALRQLDRLVSVDSHFQTYCRAVGEFEDPASITLLPNPVDTSWFVPRKDRPSPDGEIRVLYPRRLSYERGLVTMMLSADELLSRYPSVTVEFAGELIDGSMMAAVFGLWHEAHPHRDRIIHRTYTFETIREAYHQADIAVIPTLFSEGTSLSCLEAMSCGLPVVATNVGGLNDLVVNGMTGRLTPPSAEAITPAISELIEQPRLRRRLGAAARRAALTFDQARWLAEWKAIIAAQLEKRDGCRR